jgi:hypothetical protein
MTSAGEHDREDEPTRLGPVGAAQLRLRRDLAQAVPSASRDEAEALRQHLQAAPPEEVGATVERLRELPAAAAVALAHEVGAAPVGPAPVLAPEPRRPGFDFAAALQRAQAAVPVPEPPPALLGEQALADPRGAQAAREGEARLQAWSHYTLAVVLQVLVQYERSRQA